MPKKKKIKKEKVEEEPKNGQVPEAEEEIAKKNRGSGRS